MVALRHDTPLIPPDLMQARRVIRDLDHAQAGDVLVTWQHGAARAQQIERAKKQGISAVVCEAPAPLADSEMSFTVVDNARQAFALMSVAAHDLPPAFPLIGVTGTDGKTSLVHVAHHCLGPDAARIGSLGMVSGDRVVQTGHTSPPSEVTHEFLASLPINCPGAA